MHISKASMSATGMCCHTTARDGSVCALIRLLDGNAHADIQVHPSLFEVNAVTNARAEIR
jgi:hypothetical protein